jgi:uroporphyrinogen decarboxylase
MNSRERILAAIQHKQPDRIPVDLGATPSSGISVVAYKNLINHMGMGHLKNKVYDVIQEVTQPEMELLDHFGVDVLDIGREFNTAENYWQELELIAGTPAFYPKWFNPEKQADGSWLAPGKTGEFIGKMPQGATFFDQLIFPYKEGYPDSYEKLGDEMGRVIWGGFGFTPYDWIDEPGFWEMLRAKTLVLRQKTDKALLLGVGCNLFEWGTFLRRIDNFLMDLFLETDQVHKLMDALMVRHMEFLGKVCAAVGDIVDILKFGDDLGTNTGPFIPNETYREFFLPRHKQMCEFVKANSKAHTMLHCCGGIYELIPDLIEAGFEILNPIQINAINMEPKKLKLEFGKDLTFWGGGVNTQSVLNRATPGEVKKHVTQNLEAFYTDGGFVFNTVHNILSDVPPQNIVAMFEAVKEFRG